MCYVLLLIRLLNLISFYSTVLRINSVVFIIEPMTDHIDIKQNDINDYT